MVKEPGTQVDPSHDEVRVHGRPIPGAPRLVYFMLHKPVGVLTTLDDPEGRRTVREFLPPGPRLFPVGRLDADTSGLLLFTNDGDLAHKLMHPRYGVRKVYRVRVPAPPGSDQVRKLREGVRIEPGFVSSPAEVKVRNARANRSEIEIVVHEGRYRQVRRMCEAVGLTVVGLHRAAYGPLRIGALPRGQVRALTAFEVGKLREESARPGGLRGRLEATRKRLTERKVRPAFSEPLGDTMSWPAGPAIGESKRPRAGRFPGERVGEEPSIPRGRGERDTEQPGRAARPGTRMPARAAAPPPRQKSHRVGRFGVGPRPAGGPDRDRRDAGAGSRSSSGAVRARRAGAAGSAPRSDSRRGRPGASPRPSGGPARASRGTGSSRGPARASRGTSASRGPARASRGTSASRGPARASRGTGASRAPGAARRGAPGMGQSPARGGGRGPAGRGGSRAGGGRTGGKPASRRPGRSSR